MINLFDKIIEVKQIFQFSSFNIIVSLILYSFKKAYPKIDLLLFIIIAKSKVNKFGFIKIIMFVVILQELYYCI